MKSITKSSSRKRNSEVSGDHRERKRVCLEDFFVEAISIETILNKFQNQIKKLDEDEGITLTKLKSLTKTIKQLKEHDLLKNLAVNDILKVIKQLTNFIKDGFIRECQSNRDWDISQWKTNVETTFKACLICLSLLSHDKIAVSDGDDDHHVNDVVFFLRKVLDEINAQMSRARDLKKANTVQKSMLLENLTVVGDLIKVRRFSTVNTTGLITSFIHTVLHHSDLDIQMAALWAILNFYKKGEEFRALILNLTFKSIGKVHDNYRFHTNCKINDTLSVSVFTVLVMSFIENVPILGFYTYQSGDVAAIQNSQNLLCESFEDVLKVTCFIITTFIKKIASNADGHRTYSLFLGHLAGDLIEMCNEPDWPSSRLTLNLLLKPLTEILMVKPSADASLKTLSIRILGQVIKKKISDKIAYEPVLESLRSKFDSLREGSDFTEFAQRLLISHLSKAESMQINSSCKLLHAIQWFETARHEPNAQDKISRLAKLFTEYDFSMNGVICLEDEESEKRAIVHYLDTVRRNYADYHVILKYVLFCCHDKNRKVKNVATQYIFELATLDVDLLSDNMISKIAKESLLVSAPSDKEKISSIIDRYLTKHPEKCEEYSGFLPPLLDLPLAAVRKNCIDLILKIVTKRPDLTCKPALCRKVLNLIQCEDPNLQKQVVDFCTHLWIDNPEQHLDALLDIVEIPSASKNLRIFFEEVLKPSALGETPSQSCSTLVSLILRGLDGNRQTRRCLLTLSLLVTVEPKSFTSQLFAVSPLLTRAEYSEDNAIEILTAEVLNCILPEIANPDILSYISLRSELLDKLTRAESLNYSMGLTVSLLKLLVNLSNFDKEYLYENCFAPSLDLLKEFTRTGKSEDNRVISRALCVVVYLHVNFQDEPILDLFQSVLSYFLEHKVFGITAIHSLCYLSMEYKAIMKNKCVTKSIDKYLRDKRYPIMVKAVLYNILCSLKNIHKGQIAGSCRTASQDGMDAVKALVQLHMRNILDCVLDGRTEIRQTTYAVIRQLLISGLVPDTRLIPSILLMSTDPVESLSDAGIDIMTQIPLKKLFDVIRNADRCLLASLTFSLECLKQDYIRGYRNRRGKVEAACNHFYVMHQEDEMMRQQIIDSILSGLTPSSDIDFVGKLYLTDNLAFFAYRYQAEVYYVLWQIEAALSAAAIPEDVPLGKAERTAYVDKYSGLYLLTFVKSALMHHYRFTEDKLRKYYQEHGRKDLVQANKYFVYDTPSCLQPGSRGFDSLPEKICEVGRGLRQRRVDLDGRQSQ